MQTEKKKIKFPSNPRQIGPGIWYSIHILAKNAITEAKKNEFIDYMYLLSVEFPCGNCRNHIQVYLNEHPFDPFMNLVNEKGEDVGMFKWTWMFHNAVNARLHKPILDWDTAWEMFETGKEVCTNCSVNNSVNNSFDSHEDSLEGKITYLSPNDRPEPKSPRRYVDKKTIIQGYFLKKALNNN